MLCQSATIVLGVNPIHVSTTRSKEIIELKVGVVCGDKPSNHWHLLLSIEVVVGSYGNDNIIALLRVAKVEPGRSRQNTILSERHLGKGKKAGCFGGQRGFIGSGKIWLEFSEQLLIGDVV